MRRPRVLQVVTRWVRGGARRVVQSLLDGLPAAGFDVDLACGPEGAPDGAHAVPGLLREIRPGADLAAAVRLAALIRRLKPDLVHAHTSKAGVLGSLAARASGVRAVLSPHGHPFAPGASIPGMPRGWKRGCLKQLSSLAGAVAARVVALSDLDLRQQVELGLVDPAKGVVIRNGIEVDRYAARAPRAFGDGPVVGAVGRLESEKGHAVLLAAWPALRREKPGARLVIVGSGSLEAGLRALAGPGVVFAGERDAAELLGSFDVFVQPSLYEAQGLAVIEAMAAGVPVVATDVGGVADVVRPGETGLLVPPSDPAALAGAVLRLLDEGALARHLSAAAAARVRSHYSVDRMVEDHARLYRGLL